MQQNIQVCFRLHPTQEEVHTSEVKFAWYYRIRIVVKFVLATVDVFIHLLGDLRATVLTTYRGIGRFFVEENAKIFSLETWISQTICVHLRRLVDNICAGYNQRCIESWDLEL